MRLPSLTHLRCFESAARHQSFTAAGEELGLTQSAVSKKIKEVEAVLAEREAELEQLRSAPAPEPDRVEVPVVPASVTDTLAELAARAEALAAEVEEKTAG